jgi:hypothetical protein
MIAALASRTTARILAALAACAVTVVWSAPARADDTATDYCQKVTAHAEGDAALLFAPTVHAQLIRFPTGSPADTTGVQIGRSLQPRAAMSVGLVDVYRGFGVLDMAKADCRRQESVVTLEEVIAQRGDMGRAPALERKLAFLRAHEGAVQEIVRNAEERFLAHTSTLSEVQDVRLHALSFARRLAETQGELSLIKARGHKEPTGSLAESLATYEERTIALENGASHLRNLQPWKLNVTGGVAATPTAEVFGVAELSYNLGGLLQVGAERRAVDARKKELTNARYEMRQQIETVSRELRASAAQSRTQAHTIESELMRMSRDRASLEGTDAPNKHTIVATMTLQMLDLEAEQTFLTALADKQAALAAGK